MENPRYWRLASLGRNGRLSLLLRIALRLSAFFVALLVCSVALNRLWPRRADLLSRSGPGGRQEAANPMLKAPIMLLLMGLAPKEDEQQLPKISGFLLARLAPGQPVRLLQVPATTPVVVPGSGTVYLGRAYNIGGVRLVAELLAKHLNRPEDLVDRYILSSSPALAAFVDAMGGVPMTLLHTAGPAPAPAPAWQLERQRRLLDAMVQRLDREDLRQRWPQLAQDLLDASRTNLSREELFSVLATLQAQPLRLVVEPLPSVGHRQTEWNWSP